jgi:PAS domain S-box-containing protein
LKLRRVHNISLKWKLLIPFLFLASMGAMALFFVSYRFQAQLIHLNEEKQLSSKYEYFLNVMESKKEQMLRLATLIARDPVVSEAFALRDRPRLLAHLFTAFRELEDSDDVRQLHFHTPSGISFLRVHMPETYGDDLKGYRQTVNEARKTGQKVSGLEKGIAGFGLRGVVPVTYRGQQVGTVEAGTSFGETFFQSFSATYDADVAIFLPSESPKSGMQLFSATVQGTRLSSDVFEHVFTTDERVFLTDEWGDRSVALIVGPVRNFSNRTFAVAVISVDRGQTLALLQEYRNTAVLVGLVGLVFSISFVWFISVVFTNRIANVVAATEQIASGNRGTRIAVKGADELGVMADAINHMLGSLEESRKKVKEYAENLELMVERRTRALEESEKSFRSLVENVPLIVYFVMPDGTMVFLNNYVEQIIGVPAQQLSGRDDAWAEFMHPGDKKRVQEELATCLRHGKEFQCEYKMMHKDGDSVYVLDQAAPVWDKKQQLVRLDGIILDVTARKELQEKIIQAEELETLSEVSARLAHEIRNPLTSIGGLTRRLVKSFSLSDERKKKGELIVEEVEKLEKILEMMTSYIEPKSIKLRLCAFNEIARRAVHIVNKEYGSKDFTVEATLADDIGKINLDCGLFEEILVSLLKNACFRMKQKGRVDVVTSQGNGQVNVTIAYALSFIADDDIDHFFYPFVVGYPFRKNGRDMDIMDVPICRVLIHKHGGVIHVAKEKENVVKISISLPHSTETISSER